MRLSESIGVAPRLSNLKTHKSLPNLFFFISSLAQGISLLADRMAFETLLAQLVLMQRCSVSF